MHELLDNFCKVLNVMSIVSIIGLIALVIIEYQQYLICECDVSTWVYQWENALIKVVLMAIILITLFAWTAITLIRRSLLKKAMKLIRVLLVDFNIKIE